MCNCTVTPETGYKNGGGKAGLRTICRACNSEQRSAKLAQPKGELPPDTKAGVRQRGAEVAARKRDPYNPLAPLSQEENSDYLLQSKSPSSDYAYPYGLYEEALDKDPHLFSVWMQRKSAVMSKRREILPSDDTDDAEYAAEFHHEALRNISIGEGDSGFEKDLSEFLDAVPMGMAIGEIIWGWKVLHVKSPAKMAVRREKVEGLAESQVEQVDAKPVLAYIPVRIMSRHPRRFQFDENGVCMLQQPNGNFVHVPDYKFIVFRPYTRYENPYGVAAMRMVWWMTWFKRVVPRLWVRFTESYADPLTIAQSTGSQITPAEKADLVSMLNNIQSETGLVMPEGWELIFREPQRYGSITAFHELIDFANAEMSKAVIGQTLTTEAGHRGARSLGEVQQDVATAYTTMDAFALMALINGTLLPWIHQFNIPTKPLPRMDINIEASADRLLDLQVFQGAQAMGFDVSQKGVTRKLNIPIARGAFDILQRPMSEKQAQSPGKSDTGQASSGNSAANS